MGVVLGVIHYPIIPLPHYLITLLSYYPIILLIYRYSTYPTYPTCPVSLHPTVFPWRSLHGLRARFKLWTTAMPSSVSLGNTVEEIDGMAIGGPLSSDRVESSHAKSVLLDNVRFKVE